MKPIRLHLPLAVVVLLVITAVVSSWLRSAGSRLATASAAPVAAPVAEAAVAAPSDEGYCSPALKQILRRVLTSCGLVQSGTPGRGCQPLEAKTVAAMSGGDFNALFRPLSHRAAIIQFEIDSAELDQAAMGLLEKTFADQRGASYFLVVSRASPEGSADHNRKLSEQRAAAVLGHLKTRFQDPDLEREVGLLWLGEEFAQLDEEYCQWARSRTETKCTGKELNRSAFIAWIDCRL